MPKPLGKPPILFDLTTDARTPTELRDSLPIAGRVIGPQATKLLFRPEFNFRPGVRLPLVGVGGNEVMQSKLPFPHNVLEIAWQKSFDYTLPVSAVLLREKYLQSELGGSFRVIPMHPPIYPSHAADSMLFSLYAQDDQQMLGVCLMTDFGVQPDDLFLFTLMGYR